MSGGRVVWSLHHENAVAAAMGGEGVALSMLSFVCSLLLARRCYCISFERLLRVELLGSK